MKKIILRLLLCGAICSLCSVNVTASSDMSETSATTSKAEAGNVEEDEAVVLRPTIIRSEPAHSFETLLKLKAGDVVRVVEVCTQKYVGADWCIVEKDGIQGYIPKSKLDLSSTVVTSSMEVSETEEAALPEEASTAYTYLEDLSIKDIKRLQNAITIVLGSNDQDELDEEYLYLEDMTVKELKGLKAAIDEILNDRNDNGTSSSSNEASGETKNSEERQTEKETESLHDILLEGVANAYWDMYPSLIDPESYRVVWVKNYKDTEILIADFGKASDGKYYDIYVDSYNIKDGTRTSLGKESELPEKYKDAVELDWNEAVEYTPEILLTSDDYDDEV